MSGSRSSRFAGGLGLGYLNQAVVTLVGLWVTPFLFHRIGTGNYGLWLVAAQVTLYLTLMDFGVVTLLPREVAYITGRAGGWTNAAELPRLVGHTLRLLFWQMPVLALVSLVLWFSLPADWEPLRYPFAAVLIVFIALFPLRLFPAVLQGLQDLVFVGKAQVLSALINSLVAAGLVYLGAGLYALAAAWAASQVALAIVCWIRVRSEFPSIVPAVLPHLDWATAKKFLRSGMWVTLSQIAQVLMNGTDLVIVARILGPAAVVPYAFTGKLITVLSNQPQLLMQAAGPALSEMRAAETPERQLQALNALSQATLLASGAVACVIMAVNRGFISWWTGAAQYGGFALCALLLSVMLLRHWNNPLNFAVFSFGGERRVALTTLLDGIVTFSGSIALVWWLGPKGAPIAAIAGVCLVSLPGNLTKLASATGKPVSDLVQPLVGWLWRFCLVMAAAVALNRVWTPTTFLWLAVTAGGIGLLYAAVMLPAALAPPLGIYLRPRLARLIKWNMFKFAPSDGLS